MPHEIMNENQVAAYLHMDVRDLTRLASRGQIPCRKAGGRFQFRKGEVDHWVEQHMHAMGKERIEGIEKGVSAHHGFDVESLVIWPLVPPGGIAVPLEARTRDSAIRELVAVAERADLVYQRDTLIEQVRQREELCSTAMVPGVALPHPRHPLPYGIATSFVVVGLAPSGIPYGGPEGATTRLFFLICCKDDRTHLHVLARLALMLQEKGAVDDLLAAQSPDELRDLLAQHEQAVLGKR